MKKLYISISLFKWLVIIEFFNFYFSSMKLPDFVVPLTQIYIVTLFFYIIKEQLNFFKFYFKRKKT